MARTLAGRYELAFPVESVFRIAQFGGNSSATSPGNPAYVDIYALCVPGADIPVDTTYNESGS